MGTLIYSNRFWVFSLNLSCTLEHCWFLPRVVVLQHFRLDLKSSEDVGCNKRRFSSFVGAVDPPCYRYSPWKMVLGKQSVPFRKANFQGLTCLGNHVISVWTWVFLVVLGVQEQPIERPVLLQYDSLASTWCVDTGNPSIQTFDSNNYWYLCSFQKRHPIRISIHDEQSPHEHILRL